MRYFFSVVLLLFLCPQLSAQPAALTAARAALSATDPDRQLAALDSLRATGRESADLHLALGNAWFGKQRVGRAILHYERGLRLAPGRADLVNNLRFVRGEAGINTLAVRAFFLIRWWRWLGAALGVGLSQWIAMFCWWGAVAGAVFWYVKREAMDEKRRFALLPLAVGLLLLALFFYQLGGSRAAWLNDESVAVLTAPSAELRVAPGPAATRLQTLAEGEKLRILDAFDGYLKVARDNGEQGYVPAEVVVVI